MTAWKTWLATTAAVMCATAPAAAQVIDTFEGAFRSQQVYYVGGPPVDLLLEQTVAAAVPGGSRRLQLSANTTAPGYTNSGISGNGDLWAFGGGGQRTAFNFAYGTQAPMNLDLSGAAALRLDVYLSTPMELVIYAGTQTTPGGNPNASAFAIQLPDLFRQSVDIPLAGFFTNSATGLPADWAHVDTLSFFVSAYGPVAASGDAFWIQQLSAVPVPEPAAAWLLSAGLAVLQWRWNRSRAHR